MYEFYKRDFVWTGDDIYYQFQRIMGLSTNFTDGLLASNLSVMNFGKIGYGVNIFYPWLTLIPFKLIFQFTNNWISAYYLGLLFYFFVSFLISHYSMKKFSGSTKVAMMFSIIYNLSIYRLIDLFTRGAVAEYLATIFLPLCFLGFYEIFFGDGKQWKPLAIGMSLVIFSHVLSTFMCVIIFTLLLIFFSPKLKLTKERLLNFVKAVITTVGATLIFTIPFLMEELFQKYGVPDKQILKGQDLGKLLSESLINNSRKVVENNLYNVGLTMLIAIVLGLIIFRKFDFKYKAIYVIFVASLLLTTELVPWHIFQNTPIEVIQFPYRFLMFTTLFGSVILAQALNVIFSGQMTKQFPIVLGVLTIINGGLWMQSVNYGASGEVLASPKSYISQKMINDNAIPDSYLTQYIPVVGLSKADTVIQHQLFVNDQQSIQIPAVKGHTNEFYLDNIKKGDKIDLPYVRYKYTKANFNGHKVSISLSKRGSVQVIAPKTAKKVVIQLSYGNRKLFAGAAILSALTWIYLLFSKYLFLGYKKFRVYRKSSSV
jgi:Predicted integral membrane protein